MKTFYAITFFRKLCRLCDNVEKYDGDLVATNDVTTEPIRFVCWISKATCTRPRTRAPTRTHASVGTHTQNNK